jgi:hypothetical protein
MAQKTKRERKGRSQSRSRSRTRSRSNRRIRRRSNETDTETSPILDLLQKARAQAQGQTSPPVVEKHHFHSKMLFDGNTMITESQKDNEPVKRRKYTLKRLEREIPIAAKLVKTHLRRKVPPAVNDPFPRDIEFTSVLPNPIDLGLMPPSRRLRDDHDDHDDHDHHHDDHDPHHDDHDPMKKRRKLSKHHHDHDHDHDNEENIKLLVNELS